MSEKTPGPGTGPDPFAELVASAVWATERTMMVTQTWSDTLLTTLKEQSEDARTTLTALNTSLQAMERTLLSQEETNRALRESLEGYRKIVDRYAAASERTAQLVETTIDDLKAGNAHQVAAVKALLAPPQGAPGSTPVGESFAQLMTAWPEAFTRISGGSRTTGP